MVIDFNRLNLIEARLKRLKKNSPAAWSVVMDCGHQHVLSDEQIHKPDEQRYGEDLYYCAKCAIGDRTGTGDEDFCKDCIPQDRDGNSNVFTTTKRTTTATARKQISGNFLS